MMPKTVAAFTERHCRITRSRNSELSYPNVLRNLPKR